MESQMSNMGGKEDDHKDIIQQLKEETGIAEYEKKCEKEVRDIKKRFNYDLQQMNHSFDKKLELQEEEHQRKMEKAAVES